MRGTSARIIRNIDVGGDRPQVLYLWPADFPQLLRISVLQNIELSINPTCQTCRATLPFLLARLRRERVLPPPTAPPGAISAPCSGCRPHAPLFLSFSLRRVARPSRPPISLSALPVRLLIWRRRQCLTPLRFTPEPELELPSFSTAYAPASPAFTTGDPPSSLVPVRVPPPPPLHGETLSSTTVVPI
jgi:hypothetical protein